MKQFNIHKPNASLGAGLRVELMGRIPLMIGYAVPINPDYKKDRQNFFFSMAGQF